MYLCLYLDDSFDLLILTRINDEVLISSMDRINIIFQSICDFHWFSFFSFPVEGVDQITTSIAQKSRSVIQLGKEFFHRQIYVNDISKVYEQAAQTMANNLKLQDAQEGLKSFIEKRTPKWSNKC